MMSYIVQSGEAGAARDLGGKARSLSVLAEAGFPVPKWFVVSPQAFYDSLNDAQKNQLARWEEESHEASEAPDFLDELEPNPAFITALENALAQLCPNGELVAVRSSATEEDSANHSFAGQLESFLFVSDRDVKDKIVQVWKSAFSERVLKYRAAQKLIDTPKAPAVIIQHMVRSDVSGVAFGADPITGNTGVAVVSSLYGLGTALVTGECNADVFYVDEIGSIVQRDIVNKHIAHLYQAEVLGGLCPVKIPDPQAGQPSLTDAEIAEITNLVRQAGKVMGYPQDVEWAIANHKLYILQSRPITTPLLNQTSSILSHWDNTDFMESWGGITTPLTFSFARRYYAAIYRQFCRFMRVSNTRIAENEQVFSRIIGLIRGRIYYNNNSLNAAWSFIPGFAMYRENIERFLGISQDDNNELASQKQDVLGHFSENGRMLGTLLGLISNHFTHRRRVKQFMAMVEKTIDRDWPDIKTLDEDSLSVLYHRMGAILYTRWSIPLLNNFYATVFYSLLGKYSKRWCNDVDGSLQNDLLCGEGGLLSIEPVKQMESLARCAMHYPNLLDALCSGSVDTTQEAMEAVPEFKTLYDGYMSQYGDRCPEDLKLECPNIADDPLLLFRAVGHQARQYLKAEAEPLAETVEKEQEIRKEAEKQVAEALEKQPWRRLVFNWILRNTRSRVRDRENMRFLLTRLIGKLRLIFNEIGQKFEALGVLDDARDIYYLEITEILGYIDGAASCTNLKGLVSVRKAEFQGYAQLPAPASQFETYGIVHKNTIPDRDTALLNGSKNGHQDTEQRKGIGCSPGTARGPIMFISDPRNACLKGGEILLARQSDPGFMLLLPSASGLLFEHGSPLSHMAIVSREMGIPTVMSLADITGWLKDGDWVEIDGRTGTVTKIEAVET